MNGKKLTKNHILITFSILIIILISAAIFMKSSLFKVKQITTETHLEVGHQLSKNPADYLAGEDWCVSLSYVDTSSVKHNSVGRYPVYIYHGFYKYTSYVNVTDTTAPVVSCDVKTKTVKPGDVVSVNSLGLDIQDHSEIESIAFTKISSTKFYTGLPEEKTEDMRAAYKKGLEMQAEEFQFSYGGIYTLTISVTDTYHNTSEITLTLKVEEPPVLEVPTDFYVATASAVTWSDYIDAWDFIDEEFDSESVTVDTSDLNLGKSGDYTIHFSAKDDYGLSSTVSSIVHVRSQDDLQELINNHSIQIAEDVIIGAHNPYDIGYYENEELSTIQSLMLPTIVYIENDKSNTFGSGFIIEITDEFVTIATNEHVITNDLISDVAFFDGTVCNGSVVASDPREDMAFIRIPIDGSDTDSSLTSEYVKNNLRTVHIDESYWGKLSNDCGISICYNCIQKDGSVWTNAVGTIVEKVGVRDWNNYTDINQTIVSFTPVGGSSGSALFDEQGRLMGMMRGYTDYGTYQETIAVPLNELLDYFEVIFKYKIQY